jgi:hypothetical protein
MGQENILIISVALVFARSEPEVYNCRMGRGGKYRAELNEQSDRGRWKNELCYPMKRRNS